MAKAPPRSDRVDPTVRLVARRVRQLRRGAGLTQEDVAARAKLTPKFISSVENGRVNPSVSVLARLVEDGLGVPVTMVFVDERQGQDDSRGDLEAIKTIVGTQPAEVRRRVLRALRAAFELE